MVVAAVNNSRWMVWCDWNKGEDWWCATDTRNHCHCSMSYCFKLNFLHCRWWYKLKYCKLKYKYKLNYTLAPFLSPFDIEIYVVYGHVASYKDFLKIIYVLLTWKLMKIILGGFAYFNTKLLLKHSVKIRKTNQNGDTYITMTRSYFYTVILQLNIYSFCIVGICIYYFYSLLNYLCKMVMAQNSLAIGRKCQCNACPNNVGARGLMMAIISGFSSLLIILLL